MTANIFHNVRVFIVHKTHTAHTNATCLRNNAGTNAELSKIHLVNFIRNLICISEFDKSKLE